MKEIKFKPDHSETPEAGRESVLMEILTEAGKILREYHQKGLGRTEESKGGMDFLTEADAAVDKFLIKKISEKFPQSEFLTEETAPQDLNYEEYRKKSDLWIIDPIDGTLNFSRGHENFAISIANVSNGITKESFIHLPVSEKTYHANSDSEGAFLNGKRIEASETQQLDRSTIAADWPWDLKKREIIVENIRRLSPLVRQIKMMGSAVSDISSLAEGKIDAYFHAGLKPWDVAAASLLAEKAGAKITNLKGEPWDIFTPDILVTNSRLHDQIIEKIK